MSAPRAIARRIVLRLDPARSQDSTLARVLQFAKAFHAELAARMIADTRLAGVFAMAGLSGHDDLGRALETQLRRAESNFRRALAALAADEHTAWSFEVIHCAGLLAQECATEPDDLVAIELPRLELSMSELHREIEDSLAHARGVVLLPSALETSRGPVIAITRGRKDAQNLIDAAGQIAAALDVPLKVLEHDGQSAKAERQEAGDIATAVRKLGATLAVVDAGDTIVEPLLARPRHLREMAAPLLLLKSQA
jgi:hypothetical protein